MEASIKQLASLLSDAKARGDQEIPVPLATAETLIRELTYAQEQFEDQQRWDSQENLESNASTGRFDANIQGTLLALKLIAGHIVAQAGNDGHKAIVDELENRHEPEEIKRHAQVALDEIYASF